MSGKLTELLNPVTLQGKMLKWTLILLVIIGVLIGVYLQGRSDGKLECVGAMKTVAARVANQRADNAVSATERYRLYTLKDRELEVGIADALEQVYTYYSQEQPANKVAVAKLVQVPGEKEYVYVPSDACPNAFLNDDELRLFNLGNSRSTIDPSDSK